MVEEILHFKNLGHPVNTLIHVGAHEAEELEVYACKYKVKNILLMEPNPDKYSIINSKIQKVSAKTDSNIVFYPLAAGSKTGKDTLTSFHGRSSGLASILKPKVSLIRETFGRDSLELSCNGGGVDQPTFQHTIYISSLGKVVEKHQEFQSADLLVVDTQGYELEVLKGFKKFLRYIKSIDLEVTVKAEIAFYEKNPSESECRKFLNNYGFVPDPDNYHLWGLALHGKMLYRNNQIS